MQYLSIAWYEVDPSCSQPTQDIFDFEEILRVSDWKSIFKLSILQTTGIKKNFSKFKRFAKKALLSQQRLRIDRLSRENGS